MAETKTKHEPLGFIRNLTDGSMVHLVYPGGSISFAFPIEYAYEMVADGVIPLLEFTESELKDV